MGRHAEGWKLEWRRGIAYVRFSHGKRQHLVSTGTRDPRKAPGEAARLYARVVAGGTARPANTRALVLRPLVELWAEWLASLIGTLDQTTIDTYETTYVGKHWPAHYDSIEDMCSEAAREAYRTARLKAASRQTVQKEVWAQDKFLRWAKKLQVIGATPPRLEWDKRTLGTRTGPQRATAQELEGDQVETFLAHLPEWHEVGKRAKTGRKPFPVRGRFVVMYETSLRPATLSELVYGDVKGDRLTIRDEADKVRFGRTVPLSERAVQAIAAVRAGAQARGLDVGPDAPIFGAHLYRKTLARAARAAGLETIAPYDLRHARATHLERAGASLTGIGHLLGHKRVSTTARYIHGSERAASEALAKSLRFQVNPELAPRTPDGSDAQTPEKTGWPTGLEPATPGATRQQSGIEFADLDATATARAGTKTPQTAGFQVPNLETSEGGGRVSLSPPVAGAGPSEAEPAPLEGVLRALRALHCGPRELAAMGGAS